VREGVATIPVEGPLFAKANLMTMFSGATSYDVLATDFTEALNDPSVKAIILNIASPGGQVDGASEFSQMVTAARGTKPIVAFVSGTAASAAYWIASAADQIVAADTAQIGSIGVQMGMRVADAKAGEKSYRFVSSNAQNKNADPGTEAGAKQVQALVDDLEAVFIGAVAQNRNTTAEKVVELFGQGAVFAAKTALERGMISGIGTYESVFTALSNGDKQMDFTSLTVATLTEKRPDLVAEVGAQAVAKITPPDLDAIRAEAATAERNRIESIDALMMPGAESIIADAKADAKATADSTSVKLFAAVRAGTIGAAAVADPAAAVLAGLKGTEAAVVAPTQLAAKDSKVLTEAEAADQAIEAARKAGVIS
jgi:signal peptide peptidase SppA